MKLSKIKYLFFYIYRLSYIRLINNNWNKEERNIFKSFNFVYVVWFMDYLIIIKFFFKNILCEIVLVIFFFEGSLV